MFLCENDWLLGRATKTSNTLFAIMSQNEEYVKQEGAEGGREKTLYVGYHVHAYIRTAQTYVYIYILNTLAPKMRQAKIVYEQKKKERNEENNNPTRIHIPIHFLCTHSCTQLNHVPFVVSLSVLFGAVL